MSGQLFVIEYGDKWVIEEENSDLKIVLNTKEDAVREARKMAREKRVVLSIQGQEDQIK